MKHIKKYDEKYGRHFFKNNYPNLEYYIKQFLPKNKSKWKWTLYFNGNYKQNTLMIILPTRHPKDTDYGDKTKPFNKELPQDVLNLIRKRLPEDKYEIGSMKNGTSSTTTIMCKNYEDGQNLDSYFPSIDASNYEEYEDTINDILVDLKDDKSYYVSVYSNSENLTVDVSIFRGDFSRPGSLIKLEDLSESIPSILSYMESNDFESKIETQQWYNIQKVSLDQLFKMSDIKSIHLYFNKKIIF